MKLIKKVKIRNTKLHFHIIYIHNYIYIYITGWYLDQKVLMYA